MYTCPMHPEIKQTKKGHCSICGMDLVKENEMKKMNHENKKADSYTPLFIIIGLILLTTIVVSINDSFLNIFSLDSSMRYFMAGFFLVFSGFKLLDLKGFAQGYSTYDLLAKKVFSYGYLYPFIELTLGLLYLVGYNNPLLHIMTFIVMVFSGIGVAIKVLKHEKFQCACLGTFLKVPLSKVTLIEDFGMAFMALLMLII